MADNLSRRDFVTALGAAGICANLGPGVLTTRALAENADPSGGGIWQVPHVVFVTGDD